MAENKNTPPEALMKLASDENEEVREAVAKHKNTPSETLMKLASDEDVGVREVAVANSKQLSNQPIFSEILKCALDTPNESTINKLLAVK